jgi:hypothetical protein
LFYENIGKYPSPNNIVLIFHDIVILNFFWYILKQKSIWFSCSKENGCFRQRMRVGVVVLGDVGRSPRMCYHALSLAHNGYEVNYNIHNFLWK